MYSTRETQEPQRMFSTCSVTDDIRVLPKTARARNVVGTAESWSLTRIFDFRGVCPAGDSPRASRALRPSLAGRRGRKAPSVRVGMLEAKPKRPWEGAGRPFIWAHANPAGVQQRVVAKNVARYRKVAQTSPYLK
jgi:hypothetical protein